VLNFDLDAPLNARDPPVRHACFLLLGALEVELLMRRLEEFLAKLQTLQWSSINATMEVNMTRRDIRDIVVLVLLLATLTGGYTVRAAEGDEQAALIKALGDAKVTLQQGLAASEQEGQPISAKFEVDKDKLQLSIYTSMAGKFSEVLIDCSTGKIAKVDAIAEGEDLAAAKAQSSAMAKAKSSLRQVVDKAASESTGLRAVSVVPDMKDGHVMAAIALLHGKEFKTVQQQLD